MADSRETINVSVVLPTFNRAGFIGEAIESLLNQERRPREVIVIDDGSTDGTAAACAAFGDQVRYHDSGGNFGKSAAINRGLSLASGEFVWVMDDDDIAPPDALSNLLAPLQKDPSLGFSYGRLRKFRQADSGQRIFENEVVYDTADSRRLLVRLMEDCFITGQPCVLVRRTSFEAIAPLDEEVRVSVDYNILLRLARRFESCEVDAVVLWQRQHPGLRGPQAMRYSEAERIQKWMASDAALISRLSGEMALWEYLYPAEPPQLSALERRRAYFQKAVIAARKNLWDAAVQTLEQGMQSEPRLPLTAQDRDVLRNMLGSRYGIDQFLDSADVQASVKRAAGRGALGRAVRTEIASHLTYWIGQSLKQGDWRQVYRITATLLIFAESEAPAVMSRPLLRRLSLTRASTKAGVRPSRRAGTGPSSPGSVHRSVR